jgi:hypothetical protein
MLSERATRSVVHSARPLLSVSPSCLNAMFTLALVSANTHDTRYDGGAWTLHTRSYVAATANVMVTRLWWTQQQQQQQQQQQHDPQQHARDGPSTRAIRVETNPLANGAPSCLRQNGGLDGPAGGGVQWFNRSLGRTFRAMYGHPRSIRKTRLMRIAVGTAFAGIDATQRVTSPSDGDGGSASIITLRPGQECVVVTALHTNRDFLYLNDANPNEPLMSVGDTLRGYMSNAGEGLANLEAAHAAWWSQHWAASGVQFALDPDGQLSVAERMWYGTVYMLTVTNRVNYTIHTPPAGLWHNFYTSDTLPWSGYTTDINTQSPYFGASAANHGEVELAMIDLHDLFIPQGRIISSAAYNCSSNGQQGGGVLLPVEIAAYGGTKIWDDQGLKSNAVLMAMVHINHARLTGEVGGQIYRFIREVAMFWQCYLVRTPLEGGRYVYADLNDCCYEICSANNYDAETAGGFVVSNNPTNSLAMIRTLLEAAVDFSTVLGVDADLRPSWRDILSNLAPYPTREVTIGGNASMATIFVDWDGAPPPPKNDKQMLGCIQIVYPAGRVSSSSANRTLFRTAKNLLDYLDQWDVSSDADCILFQISTRLNYNQTAMYPNFAWALGSEPREGYARGNLFQNGLTQAQNVAGALQYVNELLVRSDEPFVRFFPAHFSSIGPEQHGLPLPAVASVARSGGTKGMNGDVTRGAAHGGFTTAASACNLTGFWFDLSNNGTPHPNPFIVKQTGAAYAYEVAEPNEWGCPVNITRSEVGGSPAVPPSPRLDGHPKCGVSPHSGHPAVLPHTQMQFVWPPHGSTEKTVQNLTVTPDCKFMCFPPAAAAEGQGPYGRTHASPPPGVCADAGSGGVTAPARPWLNSSFSNLRVKGAQGTEVCPLTNGLCTFLVGGSLSAVGVVGQLTVLSERGGNFTFLSPFAAGVLPTVLCVSGPGCSSATSGGATGTLAVSVPITTWAPLGLFHLEEHEVVFAFETASNSTYAISAS